MPIELWQGLLIPFAGTTLGAACVFFMRNNLSELVQRALTGFAAGVMVAASVWSLLLPAMEQAADMGQWSFVPAVVGFWLGILFLLGLNFDQPVIGLVAALITIAVGLIFSDTIASIALGTFSWGNLF